MLLHKALNGIDYKSNLPLENIEIKNIRINSKDVKRGDLFVAIKGQRFDGHNFLEQAFKKGAIASLVSKNSPQKFFVINVKDTRKALPVLSNNFYAFPSRHMKTIGITGTNGKTTTSYLVTSVLEHAGFKTASIGTINYKIGDKLSPSFLTTPDAIVINDILKKARQKAAEYAVLEVSSHALEQHRVEGIDLDIAIFTNLTLEHLDYHKDIESYFRSKMKIFNRLKPNGVAILNFDDPRVRRIEKLLERDVITYGLKKNCTFCADIETLNLEGTRVSIYGQGRKIKIHTKLIGRHNIYNILASAAACSTLKIKPEFIKKGIEDLRLVPGRLQTIDCGQPFKVFIDYAHTHDALFNVLNMLKIFKKKRLITVFGCGGDRDRFKRPLMGKVAVTFSDATIITTDNPRTEDPSQIIRDIEKGINKRRYRYNVISDRKKAIKAALQIADKDDIVLIAGKGHESTQIIGDKKIYFNDAEVTREILCSKLKI